MVTMVQVITYGNVKNVVSNRSVSHREEKYGNVMYEDVSY
jgi:hypothetical protein